LIIYNIIKDKYTLHEQRNIYMKKALSPINIDKKLYRKLDSLLNMHRELGYKSKVQFVENAIEEKLDTIQDKLILTKIKESGLDSVIGEAKEFQKMKQQAEATSRRMSKALDKILGKKHTPRVYKSKKK